jgi:hypothetical protein
MNANFTAVKDAMEPLQVSNYTKLGGMNQGSVNITATPTQLNIGSKSFTKSRSDTNIEVHVNSNFDGGTFSGGTTGVMFSVMIDGSINPTFGSSGSILVSNTIDFLSMYAVFQGLAAGPHTVSLWAQTNGGSSSSVGVDPGGFGGAIIVKESH